MNLNKSTQYGILFALYLSRAGRATAKTASENLNLSPAFLSQVARRMREYGVIQSQKGPGGGYFLTEGARIIDVLNALDQTSFLTLSELSQYRRGQPEERALHGYVTSMGGALKKVLFRSIVNIMQENVANEMAQLNRVDIDGLEN